MRASVPSPPPPLPSNYSYPRLMRDTPREPAVLCSAPENVLPVHVPVDVALQIRERNVAAKSWA